MKIYSSTLCSLNRNITCNEIPLISSFFKTMLGIQKYHFIAYHLGIKVVAVVMIFFPNCQILLKLNKSIIFSPCKNFCLEVKIDYSYNSKICYESKIKLLAVWLGGGTGLINVDVFNLLKLLQNPQCL